MKKRLAELLLLMSAERVADVLCCDTLNRGLMDKCEECPLSSSENYKQCIDELLGGSSCV